MVATVSEAMGPILDSVVGLRRLIEAATELVDQAWHDGDGYSMKVDGDTFAHLAEALADLAEGTTK